LVSEQSERSQKSIDGEQKQISLKERLTRKNQEKLNEVCLILVLFFRTFY